MNTTSLRSEVSEKCWSSKNTADMMTQITKSKIPQRNPSGFTFLFAVVHDKTTHVKADHGRTLNSAASGAKGPVFTATYCPPSPPARLSRQIRVQPPPRHQRHAA
ncbi:hypothetical protein SBBP2_1110004 [Burkholderiales bacterium]|nr:hypothetical protein SBBP2_1110004 [Burkholderiales bacterium]